MRSEKSTIDVIIPTFNRVIVTRRSVESLRGGTDVAFDLSICDSGSSDGTRETLSEEKNIIVLNL
jgi:glycosyltransferase involved in cell wall biosynthesis